MEAFVRRLLKPFVPRSLRRWVRVAEHELRTKFGVSPPIGWVRFGSFGQLRPISGSFGHDRGVPIDRYYIENFLATHEKEICGRILEIGDDTYTRRFGGDRVSVSDVLHVTTGNPKATIVADLTRADAIPSEIVRLHHLYPNAPNDL